ncbi:MAG: amidohydrolase [Nocardiopsaceae bacterium]|jgi:hippurate hydrolase|nr:amidohydrolase [Nocardiopsaceae bacterium]
MALDDRLRDDASALAPDLARLRHDLHAHPEVGLDLPVTQQTVLTELDGLGLEITTGRGLSSVTGVLRGGRPGPAVLLRGDMDALPLTEATGLSFASTVAGAMHACGHDLHTAMLVGAARLLAAQRAELAGDVVFMFQPGEEGWDGAGHMLAEGVLEAAGKRVSAAYGMHVSASLYRRSVFTTRPGPLMAASSGMFVTVRGEGGHGSAPHRSRDPITAAAEMVTALQTLVTRRFDVFDPVVVTVGQFHAGTRRNIIPDEARFEATIRTFSERALDQIQEEAPALCRRIGAAYGVDADVQYSGEYPATVNDPGHAQFAADVITDIFGADRYQTMDHPLTGSEDFSRVLEEVPGCYVFLGAHTGDTHEGRPDNHSSRAEFDDSVLADGALLHAQLAVRALQRAGGAVGAA